MFGRKVAFGAAVGSGVGSGGVSSSSAGRGVSSRGHFFYGRTGDASDDEPYEEFGSYGYDDYGYGYEYDGYDSER